ncbi:MAG: CHAP domain-containing protein, partial [Oscillospiraceae bacterium]
TPVYRSINPDYYPEENSEYNYTDLTPGDDGTDNPYGIDVDAFLHWAYSQLGYTEKASNADLNSKGTDTEDYNNFTKYGEQYGKNGYEWCAMFASWCALKAEIPEDEIYQTSSTNAFRKWYEKQGRFQAKGSGYTPNAGDIILYQWYTDAGREKGDYIMDQDGTYKYVGKENGNYKLGGHTGIVIGYENGYVYTIEGNYDNARGVCFRRVPIGYSTISGFCVNGGSSSGYIPTDDELDGKFL